MGLKVIISAVYQYKYMVSKKFGRNNEKVYFCVTYYSINGIFIHNYQPG